MQLYKRFLSFGLMLFCLYSSHTFAQQNLVPNFSFEIYDTCPYLQDQIEFAIGWSKYSNANSTPDYYNACSSPSALGVPQSFFLYQPDNRGCSAYMALVTWTTNPNEREHIGVQLTQPLVIGQKYFLSFYTVRGGSYDGSFYLESPSNNIGMRLSTLPYSSSNPAPIDNFAHLRSTSIISDTTNWIRISGSIVADSAYQYLMLGNFYDDANTDTTTLTCGNCINNYSYYLIDDVCISTDSTLCNGGIDAIPCVVSVEENEFKNHFSFYPNPASSFVTIKSSFNTPFDVSVYNSIGQLLYAEQNINTDNLQLDISHYNTGLLFIKITSKNNQFLYKLLKQ